MKAFTEIHPATPTLAGHVRHGNGPIRVLVLHDWLGDHGNYEALMPCLDGQAFSYVFMDARGYGLSRDMEGEYSVQELARDGFALADHLGWARFHVMGHSMTGMVTQRMAADAPARILGAVAVCPVSAAGNRLDPQALAFFASTAQDDAALRRLFQFVTPGLSRAWIDAKLRRNREAVAPHCRARYLDMLVTADFADQVQGLQTPFLVVIGDRDPGLDAAAMERSFLAWHPNARLQVMPHCGHYPMQECPPFFAAVIEEFLRGGLA
jgi:pimeloyl-ACP methyl ester carboxylesterase